MQSIEKKTFSYCSNITFTVWILNLFWQNVKAVYFFPYQFLYSRLKASTVGCCFVLSSKIKLLQCTIMLFVQSNRCIQTKTLPINPSSLSSGVNLTFNASVNISTNLTSKLITCSNYLQLGNSSTLNIHKLLFEYISDLLSVK